MTEPSNKTWVYSYCFLWVKIFIISYRKCVASFSKTTEEKLNMIIVKNGLLKNTGLLGQKTMTGPK